MTTTPAQAHAHDSFPTPTLCSANGCSELHAPASYWCPDHAHLSATPRHHVYDTGEGDDIGAASDAERAAFRASLYNEQGAFLGIPATMTTDEALRLT